MIRNRQVHLEFEALFTALPGLYVVLDVDPPKFTVLSVTDALVRSALSTRRELIGRGIVEFMSRREGGSYAPAAALLLESLERVVSTGVVDSIPVRRLESIDGTAGKAKRRFWGAVNAPVLGADGRVRFVIHRVDDETESELLESVRNRDELLAVAAHELATPLTPLQLSLDHLQRLLAHAGPVDPRVRSRLDSAARQTRRLTRMIEALVDATRLNLGRLELDLVDCDLADLVVAAVERHRHEAEAAGSRIELELERPLPGRWDCPRIEQVVSNLVSNAIHHAGGKRIRIVLEAEHELARLTVMNHGVAVRAIPALVARLEAATSPRRAGGAGVGLYVARQIVEAHGGSLMNGHADEIGATFTVVLPRGPQLRLVPAPASE